MPYLQSSAAWQARAVHMAQRRQCVITIKKNAAKQKKRTKQNKSRTNTPNTKPSNSVSNPEMMPHVVVWEAPQQGAHVGQVVRYGRSPQYGAVLQVF